MYSRFHYILILLIIVSVYLIYLIGYYTVQQFKTSSFMEGMQTANTRTIARNSDKEFLAVYIRTPAYQSQVAKATQNKKLPGEEVINIIRGDVVE
jgi:Glu-tRNA(Gln) amidotransferase subunit E-like FAD-binding protein